MTRGRRVVCDDARQLSLLDVARGTTERVQGKKIEALRTSLLAFGAHQADVERESRNARRRWLRAVARGAGAAVPAVVLLLFAVGVAHAEIQGPPGPPAGPSAGDIGSAVGQSILGGLREVLLQTIDAWWDNTGPVAFGRLVSLAFGAVVVWVWSALGPLLGAINFWTNLPAQWTTELPPVVAMRQRLMPLAGAVLLLGLVVGILWAVLSLLMGRPFGRLLNVLPTFLLASAGLIAAPQLAAWWFGFVNATSDALLSPGTGLPGLARMELVDRLSALGVVALVYLVFALFFLLLRIKLLVVCAVLLTVMPLALVAGGLPFPQAQRFFGWWFSTFIGATFVQVLQAVCLGIGAAMIAAPVVAGGAPSGPTEDLMSATIGVGAILAASSFPAMLLGALGRTGMAQGAGHVFGTAIQIATVLAGVGAVAPAVARYAILGRPKGLPAAPGATVAPSGGYVRSLLADAPAQKLLPPPRP